MSDLGRTEVSKEEVGPGLTTHCRKGTGRPAPLQDRSSLINGQMKNKMDNKAKGKENRRSRENRQSKESKEDKQTKEYARSRYTKEA